MVEIIGQVLPQDEALIRELAKTDAGMSRLLSEFGITVFPESEDGADDVDGPLYGKVIVERYPDGSTWTIHHPTDPGESGRHVISAASESVSVS